MPVVVDFTAVQPGSIHALGSVSIPSGYLLCDGSSVSRTTYARLFQVIGTAYGTVSGTTFNLPDLRGRFVRGLDNGAGNDPDTSSRSASNSGGNTGDNVGSLQADEFGNHSHSLNGAVGTCSGGGDPGANWATCGNYSIGAAGGNETRPKNVYVTYMIKY